MQSSHLTLLAVSLPLVMLSALAVYTFVRWSLVRPNAFYDFESSVGLHWREIFITLSFVSWYDILGVTCSHYFKIFALSTFISFQVGMRHSELELCEIVSLHSNEGTCGIRYTIIFFLISDLWSKLFWMITTHNITCDCPNYTYNLLVCIRRRSKHDYVDQYSTDETSIRQTWTLSFILICFSSTLSVIFYVSCIVIAAIQSGPLSKANYYFIAIVSMVLDLQNYLIPAVLAARCSLPNKRVKRITIIRCGIFFLLVHSLTI
jgi:hypothetical protein